MAKKKRTRGAPQGETATTVTAPLTAERVQIVAGVGEGLFDQMFGGKSFLECLIEILTNSRDWGAGQIRLLTEDRLCITSFDDGDGMNAENRKSICSVNQSAARSPRQRGQFGTGSKHMLYSFATAVRILTAPKDEPDLVYEFGFDRDEFERKALGREAVECKRLPKTAVTWPWGERYGARFGTVVTYHFAEPNRRGIYRGDTLAQKLSERLPRKFGENLLYVDDQPIPTKEVIAEYKLTDGTTDRRLSVTFELYRPKNPTRDDVLYLTGSEIGEVPFDSFVKVLPPEMQDIVPELYELKRDVAGIISTSFLNGFMTSDRKSIKAAIADEPLTLILLKILRHHAPMIQDRLQIKNQAVEGSTAAEKQDITSVTSLFNATWGEGRIPPDTLIEEPGTGEGTGGQPPEPAGSEGRPFTLKYPKEIELGETVEISVVMSKDLRELYKISDVFFGFSEANGTIAKDGHTIKLTANKVGKGKIRADLHGTPHWANAIYNVVPQRTPRLSTGPLVTLTRGGEMPIMVINSDRLLGEPEWILTGVGRLEKTQGARVHYMADSVGAADVELIDTGNRSMRLTTSIRVNEQQSTRQLIWIRDHCFEVELRESEAEQYARVATMLRGQKIHSLIINRWGKGYTEMHARGGLDHYLVCCIAREYTRFVAFDLGEGKAQEVTNPNAMESFIADLTLESEEIIKELLQKKGKK